MRVSRQHLKRFVTRDYGLNRIKTPQKKPAGPNTRPGRGDENIKAYMQANVLVAAFAPFPPELSAQSNGTLRVPLSCAGPLAPALRSGWAVLPFTD